MSSRSSKTDPRREDLRAGLQSSRESLRAGLRSDLPGRITVGRVLKAHGLRGDVVVEVLSDVPGRLARGSRLTAVSDPEKGDAAGEAASGQPPLELVVAASRAHGAGRLVRFAGRADRDAVEELRGRWLTVERAAVPPAPLGAYYHFQLVGCRVRDRAAGELGEVVELIEDGGGLLLVVSDGARRVPVPFVDAFLREVDVARGWIELALPPGLLETCGSRS